MTCVIKRIVVLSLAFILAIVSIFTYENLSLDAKIPEEEKVAFKYIPTTEKEVETEAKKDTITIKKQNQEVIKNSITEQESPIETINPVEVELVRETAYVSSETGVNLRCEPSLESEVYKAIPYSEEVVQLNVSDDEWCMVEYDDSTYYVSKDFLDTEMPEPIQQYTYLGAYELTAYCACTSCCSQGLGITASGTTPTPGYTIAIDGLEFGTRVSINGQEYVVEDRGVPPGVVDIYFESHYDAIQYGRQYGDVYIID